MAKGDKLIPPDYPPPEKKHDEAEGEYGVAKVTTTTTTEHELTILKKEVADLKELLVGRAEGSGVIPHGYKIVKDEVGQDAKSLAEQKALREEIEKGPQARTQAEADRQFPEGAFRYKCILPDGNGHPEIMISAANETDAAARYLAVCGVKSTEKTVQVFKAGP